MSAWQVRAARVGKRIRDERAARGWSQITLADKAGVTKGYVSKIETGKSIRPSEAELGRMLAALGFATSDELLSAQRPPTLNGSQTVARAATTASPVHFQWPTLPDYAAEHAEGQASASDALLADPDAATPHIGRRGRDLPYVTMTADATCFVPHIEPFDRVLFDPDAQVGNGDLAVVYLADEHIIVVKVVYWLGKQVELRSLHAAPQRYEARRVQIEGRVVDRVQRIRVPLEELR